MLAQDNARCAINQGDLEVRRLLRYKASRRCKECRNRCSAMDRPRGGAAHFASAVRPELHVIAEHLGQFVHVAPIDGMHEAPQNALVRRGFCVEASLAAHEFLARSTEYLAASRFVAFDDLGNLS